MKVVDLVFSYAWKKRTSKTEHICESYEFLKIGWFSPCVQCLVSAPGCAWLTTWISKIHDVNLPPAPINKWWGLHSFLTPPITSLSLELLSSPRNPPKSLGNLLSMRRKPQSARRLQEEEPFGSGTLLQRIPVSKETRCKWVAPNLSLV